jgi:hypothetical protein
MTEYKGPAFTREQLVFTAEAILIAALDRIESGLPDVIALGDRKDLAGGNPPEELNSWDRGALETAGMALAVYYANLTDDGLGIGDALVCAGDFDSQVEKFVKDCWEDEGKAILKKLADHRAKKQSFQMKSVYPKSYPDCHKHAEAFVEKCFPEYLEANQ